MNIKNFIANASFIVNAHSPEILLGAGIIGTIVGTVLACIATTKIPEIKKDFEDNVQNIHEKEDANEIEEKEVKKELTSEYVKFGLKLTKTYLPAVIIEGLAVVSIFSSNKILRARSATVMAAYAALSSAFKKYRENVIERFGVDVEKELRSGIKKKIEEVEIIDENGEKKTVKKETSEIDPSSVIRSPFAVIFDKLNPNWCDDYVGRKYFLSSIQSFCNDKLHAQGFLFLNDVYRELGFPETKAGQVFGWRYFKDGDKKGSWHGDGFVDFGIYDPRRLNSDPEGNLNFINGYEEAIYLDFNVDGDILNFDGTKKSGREYLSEFMG